MTEFEAEQPPESIRSSQRARIANTIVKRRQKFQHFERWCAAQGLSADYPSISAIAAYIEDFDLSYSTQRNRVDSIKMTYLSRGIAWPSNDSAVRWALESVRDKKGARSSRPLSDDELDDLAHSMARSNEERDIHDWALISAASELGLDSSDLIRLRVENLRFDGPHSVMILGMGTRRKSIPTAYAHVRAQRCAVRALLIWVDTRDASMPTLFYRLHSAQTSGPLSRRDVNGIIMRRMNAIGRVAQRYSAQSMAAYALYGRPANWRSERHTARD